MNHLHINIEYYEIHGETIIRDISLIINADERIALVGKNWAGKSTFMKILSGQIPDYVGNIENIGAITLGYLEQIHFMNEGKTVRDELKDAFAYIRGLEQSIEKEEHHMSKTGEFERYTELIDEYKMHGGYTYENEVEKVARGIGIFHLLERTLHDISWGERTKIALAKILLSKPEFLLLDEPTNFIDLSSVEWLEKYLIETWKGWYLIVSHDREFLDETCEKTIEIIPQSGIQIYHGNYSFSVEEKTKRQEKDKKKYEEQQVLIETEKTLINRFRAGSRAGFAKSREKALEKIDLIEKPQIPQEIIFNFPKTKLSPETLLKGEDVFIGRKDPLFYIRDITLSRGNRIGIVGENGVGKSTFLKTILKEIWPLEWHLKLHENVEFLYFSQLHESLDPEKTIEENFTLHGFDYSKERIGWILYHYGFGYHDGNKKISWLSWGERSRILFALLGENSSNLLIFDEPTNHLDYDTRESLEKALRSYEWTILFISHDRYFVNKLANLLWIIEDGELIISYGNYEDYRYKKEHGINLDMSLFDADGEMDIVLEEKLGKVEARRIKEKFARKKRGWKN
jgi:ATP-binding cassette, subfamily F, member 3